MLLDLSSIDTTLESLAALLENVLFPILLVELIWLRHKGLLRKQRVKEFFGNASSLLLIIPLGFVGLAVWFTLFEALSELTPWNIPTNWATAVLVVVLVDLNYYLEHRFEHRCRLPWDLYHATHHSSPYFDQTTGLRLSGFDALLTSGFLTPLVFVGFDPTLVLLAYGLVVGYQTWIHTEFISRLPRWFEFVLNTPSHHRVHHGSDQKYLDTNYGGILILWDRLFGTFHIEEETPTYGLTTQIESSNPLDIQFSELRKLRQDLREDQNWGTRLRRLWQPPGWDPAEAGP